MGDEKQVLSARRSFTRFARFFNQLLREQLTCGPLTIQQFYTLEVLEGGPLPMGDLSDQVGLHQSTMSRVVDRMERDGYVARKRDARKKRLVEVSLTGEGRKMYRHLDRECKGVTSELLESLPADRRKDCVEALDVLAKSIDPGNERFRTILRGCCIKKKEDHAR
ncbi:MAG: transcriptional regulator, MarR family [Actinobacteria bacterium]|nr:transcriptional regulator, MarR family [Actinomycetota bacterium]MBM2827975.1 transcriptional regulator, MarR family [Actinomycetota bacterium]